LDVHHPVPVGHLLDDQRVSQRRIPERDDIAVVSIVKLVVVKGFRH
jgi:hypothetical protein